jgi:hypothetical protein
LKKMQLVDPNCQRDETFFFRVIRRHFLACEDVVGGSNQSGGRIIFSRNKEALACVRPWTMWGPTVNLSTYIPLPMTVI